MSKAKMLTVSEVATKLKIGKSTVYKLVKKNDLPKPVKLGNRSLWHETSIDEWFAQKSAEANT